MIAEEIRELQRAQPFEPFSVVTNDGELYVKHPDYLLISPGGHTLWVFSDEIKREVVQASNITRLIPGAAKPRGRKR